MQRKTIANTLKRKMEEWLETIPEPLRKSVRDSLLVSGGSIASMFLGEDINDFDVYIQDRDVLIKLVKHYLEIANSSDLYILDGSKDYEPDKAPWERESDEDEDGGFQWARAVRNLKPNQVRIFVRNMAAGFKVNKPNELTDEDIQKKYYPSFISPNAISLHNSVQIVNRFHGTPEEIHKTFDFIHATNYFTMKDGLVTNIPALESLLTKQLKYQGSYYPVTSIIRARKFINRKWRISAGELLKIMFQISELDLKNVDVLEDQLIGVDVAYFGALIEALVNSKKEITSTYLGALIDKIFDSNETED